jgi:antitoxin component YwqK of YwqJK toxin-antitoxin module
MGKCRLQQRRLSRNSYFYNTYLQSKKNQDGEYITEDKYFYNIDNQLIRIETLHHNSEQTEALKFYYQNGKLSSKEFYMNDKLITKTSYTYDKNGRLLTKQRNLLKTNWFRG